MILHLLVDIPAAVSLPHFLDADPSLRDNIEGLYPDKEKHSTIVVLQHVSLIYIFYNK